MEKILSMPLIQHTGRDHCFFADEDIEVIQSSVFLKKRLQLNLFASPLILVPEFYNTLSNVD